MPINLKLNFEDGLSSKEKFADDATVDDLLSAISKKIGTRDVSFFCGFPPTEIIFSLSANNGLSAAGFSSGSAIFVRVKPKIMRRIIDADNSCLFNSVSYCLNRNRDFCPRSYREIISRIILSNQDKYSEAFLGKTPQEYSRWILMDSSWGGDIECKSD